MTSPASADLSATSPATLLGDPSAAQPPQIGVGSRGRRGRGSLDLLRGNLSGKTPRAPGAPKTREEVKAGMHVIRPQPKDAPAQPAPREGLTAHGAPLRNPREIPQTGAARDERDAWRSVIGADAARFHGGIGAKAQDQMNKLLRNKARIAARRGNESLEELFKTMRREDDRAERKRKNPGKDGTDGDTGASPSSGSKQPPTDGPDAGPPPEVKKRRTKKWEGIDETLREIRGAPKTSGEQAASPPRKTPPTVQRIVIPKEEDDEQS